MLLHVLTVDSRVSSNEATKKKLPMRKEDMRDIEVDDNPLPKQSCLQGSTNSLILVPTIMYYYTQSSSTIAHCPAVEPTVYISVYFVIIASSSYTFPFFVCSAQSKHWPLKTHGLWCTFQPLKQGVLWIVLSPSRFKHRSHEKNHITHIFHIRWSKCFQLCHWICPICCQEKACTYM